MEKKQKKPTKKELEKYRDALETWYAVGWHVNPKAIRPRDAVRLLEYVAILAHMAWINRIQRGKAPAEDVLPADGFILLALFIRHLASIAKVRSVRCDLLMKEFYDKEERNIDKIEHKIREKIREKVNGTSK